MDGMLPDILIQTGELRVSYVQTSEFIGHIERADVARVPFGGA